ncbi:hypothetical protein LTR85_002051 [Meristemomyces frigidus]|nr:hypothetical protein LTR85_002051 [Meristemomyces frigidus]
MTGRQIKASAYDGPVDETHGADPESPSNHAPTHVEPPAEKRESVENQTASSPEVSTHTHKAKIIDFILGKHSVVAPGLDRQQNSARDIET